MSDTVDDGEFKKGNVNDWSKLRIVDGVIHYGVYQQDGSLQPMTAPDTMHSRQVVSWIQIHDRNVGYPGAKQGTT